MKKYIKTVNPMHQVKWQKNTKTNINTKSLNFEKLELSRELYTKIKVYFIILLNLQTVVIED